MLHHASIATPDFDRLRAFYCPHCGFVEGFAPQWAGDNPAADATCGRDPAGNQVEPMQIDSAGPCAFAA